MTKRIIYKTADGGVAVIVPASEARRQVLVSAAVFETITVPATEEAEAYDEQRLVEPASYRLETDDEFALAVALKDVPTGVPFKIVDVVDIPTDRTFRAAWSVDTDLLTDGVGNESNEFPEVTA